MLDVLTFFLYWIILVVVITFPKHRPAWLTGTRFNNYYYSGSSIVQTSIIQFGTHIVHELIFLQRLSIIKSSFWVYYLAVASILGSQLKEAVPLCNGGVVISVGMVMTSSLSEYLTCFYYSAVLSCLDKRVHWN